MLRPSYTGVQWGAMNSRKFRGPMRMLIAAGVIELLEEGLKSRLLVVVACPNASTESWDV